MGETGDTAPKGRGRPQVEMFYWVLVQAVLLYGLKIWVLLETMERKVEGTYSGLFRHIMGKRARRLGDRLWETPGAEGVREATGMQ